MKTTAFTGLAPAPRKMVTASLPLPASLDDCNTGPSPCSSTRVLEDAGVSWLGHIDP